MFLWLNEILKEVIFIFRVLFIGGKENEKTKESLLEHHFQKGCENKDRHCKICLDDHEFRDICKMRFKKFKQQKRPKLCFVSFSICDSNENLIDCLQCVQTEKTCVVHAQFANIELNGRCNFISTLREIGNFGSFNHEDYYFPNHADNCLQETIGTISSSQFTNNEKTDSNRQKTNYNQFKKQISLEDIVDIDAQDSLEYFLQKALQEESFCNSMIIGHGKTFLGLIFTALLNFNIEPSKVLRKSQTLIRIETDVNNLTFINADIFLPKSFDTLLEEDDDGFFYPTILNYEALYSWKKNSIWHVFKHNGF